MKKNLIQKAVVVAFVLSVGAANAAIDVSATTGSIGEAATGVLAVGLAVIAVAVGIKLYKWIKAAL